MILDFGEDVSEVSHLQDTFFQFDLFHVNFGPREGGIISLGDNHSQVKSSTFVLQGWGYDLSIAIAAPFVTAGESGAVLQGWGYDLSIAIAEPFVTAGESGAVLQGWGYDLSIAIAALFCDCSRKRGRLH